MARKNDPLAVTGPLVKSIVFAMVGVMTLGLLWMQFSHIRFTPEKSYSAIFTDASGMRAGVSAVTASGVNVGRVDKIEVLDNKLAKVTILIEASVPMTQGTRATIRWKNLTGDRFMDLTPGSGGPPLEEGGTLGVAQTTPSLDIDVLLGGFDPLFQGLQPKQVNQLAGELVSVLQGQGGTINQVLAHAASFTGSLGDQDKLVGGVITNLNTVLGNLDAHSGQLSETVLQGQKLVTQLSQNRKELVDGLQRTSDLADRVGNVAEALRTGHDTFHELGRAATALNQYGDEIDRVLGLLPGAYLRLARIAVGGAALQMNACVVRVRITGLDGQPFYSPQFGPSDNSPRCSRDNIAPLPGGNVNTSVHGPELAPVSDGQAVAEPSQRGNLYDAQKMDKDGHVESHKTNPGR